MNLNRAIFLLEKIVGRKVLLEAKLINDEIYDKYYFDIKREDFDKILEADPTKKQDGSMGKFSKWLLDLYKNKKLKLEDLYKATEYLTLFAKHQQKIEKKDIKQYNSLPELYDAVEKFQERPEEHLSNSEKEREAKKGTEKIWENNDWIILSPKTEEAACYYGKGTQWCTAATSSRNMFGYYNNKGPLYIIIGKKNGRKFQFHKEDGQFMDERDKKIYLLNLEPSKDYELLASDKELSKEIEKLWGKPFVSFDEISFEERVKMVIENFDEYDDFYRILDPLIKKVGKLEALKYILKYDKNEFFGYAFINEIDSTVDKVELEKEILKYRRAGFAYRYARDIKKERWPEVEDMILQDKNAFRLFSYARNIKKGRWPEAEDIIKQNKFVATDYAIYVIKGRWPEVEHIIKQDVDLWVSYINFLNKLDKE